MAQAIAAAVAMTMIAALAVTSNTSAQGRTSTPFAGVKANTGRSRSLEAPAHWC